MPCGQEAGAPAFSILGLHVKRSASLSEPDYLVSLHVNHMVIKCIAKMSNLSLYLYPSIDQSISLSLSLSLPPSQNTDAKRRTHA